MFAKTKLRYFLLLLPVLLMSGTALSQTAQQIVPQSKEEIQLSFAPLVKATAPAVVNIFSTGVVKQQDFVTPFDDDPFFRHFFGRGDQPPRERMTQSLGSGVIVDPAGVIVTNNHVIKNGTNIRVVLADKREFDAKLLLVDERSDLAVLKIDVGEEKLTALKLANSDDLDVGQLVLAIGNPFGVGQTVTSGIVSALARTDLSVSDYQFFIQTDAAINPGNSGGALVDMKGQLIGINTAIFSKSGGSIGIGFSIPSNMVATVIQSAASGGKKIIRPWAGVDMQDVTPDIANSLGFARPEGALILALHKDSPFLLAGLKRGDVVLAMDGHQIESSREFGYRLATATVGQTVIVEFQRNGKPQEAQVKMIAAPETVSRDEFKITARSPLQGLVIANLSPAVAEELGVSLEIKGVVAVDPGNGPASRLFQKGDVIEAINGKDMTSVAEVKAAVARDPGLWVLRIRRGDQVVQLTLQ